MPNNERDTPARPVGDHNRWGPWAVRPEALSILADAVRRGIPNPDASEIQAAYGRERDLSVPVTGGVAVLSLRGLITPYPSFFSFLFGGSYGLVAFRDMFRAAVADDSISAILIDVDSPGGSIDLLPETAAEIREARGSKPIVAISNTMAASAAYWLASQADEVVVTPSGQVGSIGVFLLHAEYSRMDQEMGVTTTLIRAGKYKAETSPYKPLSDEARAALQAQVDEYYEMFLADVAAGRRVPVEDVRSNYGEGRMATAQRAITMGLADRVETFDEAVVRLAGGSAASATRALARDDGALVVNVEIDPEAIEAAVESGAAPCADSEPVDETEPDDAPEPESEDDNTTAETDEPADSGAAESARATMPDVEQPEAEEVTAAELTADDRRRLAAVLLG